MQPWVAQHLRLAQARGSLTAPNSPVQDMALRMLDAAEDRDRSDAELDRMRHVLIEHPVERVATFFPDFFSPKFMEDLNFARARREDGTLDPDKVRDEDLVWRAEGVTQDEDEELTRWISQRERQTVTVADLDQGWR